MADPTTLFVGLGVHKESIAVAHAGAGPTSAVVEMVLDGNSEWEIAP